MSRITILAAALAAPSVFAATLPISVAVSNNTANPLALQFSFLSPYANPTNAPSFAASANLAIAATDRNGDGLSLTGALMKSIVDGVHYPALDIDFSCSHLAATAGTTYTCAPGGAGIAPTTLPENTSTGDLVSATVDFDLTSGDSFALTGALILGGGRLGGTLFVPFALAVLNGSQNDTSFSISFQSAALAEDFSSMSLSARGVLFDANRSGGASASNLVVQGKINQVDVAGLTVSGSCAVAAADVFGTVTCLDANNTGSPVGTVVPALANGNFEVELDLTLSSNDLVGVVGGLHLEPLNAVPEPGTYAAVAGGLAVLAFLRRRSSAVRSR